MAKCIIFPLILYLFISGHADESIDIENSSELHKTNGSKNWDFLIFTQTWPPVACLHWELENEQNQCFINRNVDSWTINGIWPSAAKGQGPTYCSTDRFNMTQFQTIRTDLTKYWPNIDATMLEHSLWAQEWKKYGTCVAILPNIETQLKYFQQGITWVKQYNMSSILKASGIEPSFVTAAFASDIKNAVTRSLNVKALVGCEYSRTNKSFFLHEIKLCFDKELKLRDCPAVKTSRCPMNYLVWYPPIQRNKYGHENDSISR